MRKVISIIMMIALTISVSNGSLYAEEEVFRGEGDIFEEETVFEAPSSWDEEEYITDNSVFFDGAEETSLNKDEYVWDDQSDEEISSEVASYESDDVLLSEETVISEDTITYESSYENVVDSGVCGKNLTWELAGEEGNMTLTISGSGEMYDYFEDDCPWYAYRTSIVNVILPEGVTSIGSSAFFECSSLTNIVIPDSVIRIAGFAFYGCSGLIDINIPNGITGIGVETFEFCSSLTNIIIPDSVTGIYDDAFFACNNLTSITIPGSVTNIGEGAFGGCERLLDINVSQDNTVYKSSNGVVYDINDTVLVCCPAGKTGEYIIPNGVSSIEKTAFEYCTKLTSVTIPASVTNIGRLAFAGCDDLTICGYVGSYAETYAKENRISFKTVSQSSEDAVASGTCGDDLIWVLDAEGTLIISGIGEMDDYDANNEPSSDSPFYDDNIGSVKVRNVVIEEGVTNIGENAFCFCEFLENVSMPESLKSIGRWAFWRCDSLKSIEIPNGVEEIGWGAFIYTPLENVTLPANLKFLDREAFSGCRKLTSIIIPDGTTKIGYEAFENCEKLKEIVVPESVIDFGDRIFEGCKNLTIQGYAGSAAEYYARKYDIPFQSIGTSSDARGGKCGDNLTWYIDNDGLLTISGTGKMYDYEFSGPFSQDFKKIIIEEGVTYIGEKSFADCNCLTSLSLPESVAQIGDSAFNGCSHLTNIELPRNLKVIGDWAFNESGLIHITLPEGLFRLGNTAFYFCTDLESVSLPDSLTNLGEWVFAECRKLSEISIPSGVTGIGEFAFYNCEKLTEIELPEGLSEIGENVFYNCTSLKKAILPSSVNSIGEKAFYCDNLNPHPIPKLVIYGNSGSYAEKYAKDNSITFKSLSTSSVSKIALNKADFNIFVGNTATIKATVTPSDATDKTLSYKSDDTSIAKVNKSGKITGVNVGTATITVIANDGSGVSASCKVNVYNKPTAKLNITKKTIYTKGEPHQFILTPTVTNGTLVSVSYSSSAPKKAYVAKSGKVTGKGAGTATITATVKMKNGGGTVTKKLTCKVTVKKPTLTVTPTSVSLKKGEKQKLTVKATPTGTVSYTSSDKTIATVSKKGKIKAQKKGSCEITVECYGIKKTVKVTVTE